MRKNKLLTFVMFLSLLALSAGPVKAAKTEDCSVCCCMMARKACSEQCTRIERDLREDTSLGAEGKANLVSQCERMCAKHKESHGQFK